MRFKMRAFTLVELAITLVIIGMVLAAITGGSHLMQGAKINKIITEFAGYKEAVENFQLKYYALPGDMPNASNFWASTSDGNGNERITGNTSERLVAWQHLTLANMIAGSYSGADAGTPDFVIDTNVPGSIVKEAYYILGYTQVYSSAAGREGNALQLVTTEDNTDPSGASLTPKDARILDKKLDETANAADGNVYVLRSDNNKATDDSCVDANYTTATTADYVMTDTSQSCRILLWLDESD